MGGAALHKAKIDSLTGLRFLAASLIVVEHSRSLQIPVPEIWQLDHAVSFFFVLSGFVLCYAYPQLNSRSEVVRFYASRAARIWPAHLFTLALLIVAFNEPVNGTLLANATLVQALIPSAKWYFSYNAVSWSISTEAFFYLCFPLLIWNWERTWAWKWALSALSLAALIVGARVLHVEDHYDYAGGITAHGLLYINPLARMLEFATGMVTCLAFRKLSAPLARRSALAFTLAEGAVLSIAAYSIFTGYTVSLICRFADPVTVQWAGHASDFVLFAFVVFVFAFGRGYVARLFANRVVVFLGEISFSIYLFHTIFYRLFAGISQAKGPDWPGLALTIAATLGASALCWLFIENPSRALAKRALNRGAVEIGSGVAVSPVPPSVSAA